MKTKNNSRIAGFCLAAIMLAAITADVFAASTTTATLFQNGRGRYLSDGDYVTEQSWVYNYYIEVPAGLSALRVDIFDADVGRGGDSSDLHDYWNNLDGDTYNFNTSCTYTLYNPSGTSVGTITGSRTAGTDNGWQNLYSTTSTPANGHWRLAVSTTAGDDDANGYGIRAYDGSGNEGSGGTELNIYASSFLPVGRISATTYPWATSGCTVDYNDFDYDYPTYSASISYQSRTGSLSGSYNGSGNSVWQNRPISMSNDFVSAESGLWTSTHVPGTYGSYTANVCTFYAGNYAASNPPPSSQPQANTFRIYLPRDGGGKPGKPIVTQKLSFVSGSNPPVSGSTTTVRVEIAVINPAAQAITFSSSNLVTANVPSTRVVYAGNTVVSQGAVVSQPAIGGTGSVTWNPGTLSAGATATFSYQVDVTPTANGQRTPLTGAPGSNGTTARYVDETGNTSQTAATYTYGPLCELAVTSGATSDPIPTWVAISCFEACASESQPTVEWHTGTEAGVVGFHLWRQDKEINEYQLVNPDFLPALPNAPQGGVYRLADPGAFSGEPVNYRLEEIDVNGRSLMYGPFTVVFGAVAKAEQDDSGMRERLGREESSDIYGYQRFPAGQSDYELERLKARRLEQQKGAALHVSQAKERVRITVKGRGLFYVTSAQIAASLGVAETAVTALIGSYGLRLTGMGKETAWLADGNGAGLFFYNEGIETVFADKNVYWLERGRGLAMEAVGAGNAGAAVDNQTYKETIHFEENRYAQTALFDKTDDDIFLWDYVIGGGGAKSFLVTAPAVSGSGNATLKVSLQGASDTAAAADHHAIVKLNGSAIGDTSWDGTKAHVFEISFNASLLSSGVNTITVSGALDTGAPHSLFYVESFDLGYQRLYQTADNSLICRGDGNPVVTVSGLTDLQPVVLDVSVPDRPKRLTGVAPDVSGRITFVPRSADAIYLVNGLNASLRPFALAVCGDRPAKLRGQGHAAEYLVIAPEEFRDAAQELADYRQSRGLKAMVVTLEDIYESFNHGMASPYAIRDFLAHAYKNGDEGDDDDGGGRKARYAVLAGKGTYDYKDYLGFGDNLVPVILARSEQGLFAADKMFGDVKGRDGIPEIAIGRLPAVTNAELKAMISKIKAYDKGQGEWTGKALFIADNADDGGDFAQGSDGLAALATGFKAEKIYLGASAQETRSKVIASWNAGAALVNYCGHAGMNKFAQENIFNAADAAALQNGGRLPLALMFTCVAGRFEIPGYTSLGEALLLNENGGMAGGLAPSGAALHADSLRFAEEFYRVAFRGRTAKAGAALLAAEKNYLGQGGKASLLNVYNWLGDPATEFK